MEHDFNELARKIARLPKLLKPGDICRVSAAISGLRDLPFPPGYLDEALGDMLKTLRGSKAVSTHVYLSFYGGGRVASYMKVGIAKNVKARMSGIKTGNPLTRLWTYSARFRSRDDAAAVEAAILAHLAGDSVHGEWVNVHGLSREAAFALVESLAEVAAEVDGYDVHFTPAEGGR